MAKLYTFRFTAQKAERSAGFISIIFGGPDTRYATEEAVLTWKEAQAHLHNFAAAQDKPAACTVRCLSKPVPPGYNKADRTIYANL